MPIQRKLLTVTLLMALLLCAVSLGGFHLFTGQTKRMIYTQTAGSLAASSDKTASRLDNLMEISLRVAINRVFQQNLNAVNEKPSTSADAVARSEITSLLYSTYHSDIISVSVFPLNAASPIVLGFNSQPEDASVQKRVTAMAGEAKGAPVWLSSGRDDGSVLLAREIRSVSEPFIEPMGLLVLRVNLEKILRESTKDILYGEYETVISSDGEILYPHTEARQIIPGESVFKDGEPYAIHGYDGEIYFITRARIRAFRLNWNFMLAIPYTEVFRDLITVNTAFIAALIFAVVLALLLSRRMLRSIGQDVRLLTDKMDKVRKGDLEPYPNPSALGWDELGTLNRYFDDMTADFKKVIEDNYGKQLLLTQTQLKALEQQINPHFLYNALESINWFARTEDGKSVSAIALALGNLLRGALTEDEDLIPLGQELKILDSYLCIQRLRFADTLRVRIEADENALDVLVPKMSIQPLAENAIIHSLEENIGVCHIEIRVTLKENLLHVEVENDGSEIDEDVLEQFSEMTKARSGRVLEQFSEMTKAHSGRVLNSLREKKVRPKGHGIGLINIDSRIKLLFGGEYGIRLESGKDRVVVSFRIPARPDENRKGDM